MSKRLGQYLFRQIFYVVFQVYIRSPVTPCWLPGYQTTIKLFMADGTLLLSSNWDARSASALPYLENWDSKSQCSMIHWQSVADSDSTRMRVMMMMKCAGALGLIQLEG